LFWSIYPRKEAKGAARTAFLKACKKISVESIIEGAKRFAADPNRQDEFTAHASTWLNQERWSDTPLPSRGGSMTRTESSVMRAMEIAEKEGLAFPLGKLVDQFNQSHIDFLADYLSRTHVEHRPFSFPYISYKPGVKIFEESHQLMVCERLLKAGYQVILCPSQFLDYDLVESLQQRFPEQVCVRSHHNLTETSTDFYPVNF
jgi:hypothetical protein